MTIQISALAAVCKISASQRSSTLRSALIVLPLKRLIQGAGMAKFLSKTKTNIAIRRCPANSGRRVSLPTQPAIRGHLQVCGHQMVSLKIHSIATGRPLWHAANIYAPTLVIAGQYDTWSFPEDRSGLMRDLVHAPVKKSVIIPDATHFELFEKNRMMFFEEILQFLKQ